MADSMTPTKPLTRAEQEEAERLCAAATGGPWEDAGEVWGVSSETGWPMRFPALSMPGHPMPGIILVERKSDRDFICAARTLLPRAFATIGLLRELLERAGENLCDRDVDDPCGRDDCPGCTWNAERKRVLEAMK